VDLAREEAEGCTNGFDEDGVETLDDDDVVVHDVVVVVHDDVDAVVDDDDEVSLDVSEGSNGQRHLEQLEQIGLRGLLGSILEKAEAVSIE
jgi:hypothetical protein